MTSTLSTTWENTDGCAEQYIYASALYLVSVLSQCHSIVIYRGISAPGHGKEVVHGLNFIFNRYMYQLMSNVQLPGSKTFDSHILMHSSAPKKYVSLAKESQKHMYKDYCKHGVIYQGKYRKISSKRKWKERDYHFQDNADFSHKDVKVYCDTNQLPTLPFCGSYPKPRGERRLGKRYHLRFDPNIGHGICAIHRIPCAYVSCTSTIDKPWISGIQ